MSETNPDESIFQELESGSYDFQRALIACAQAVLEFRISSNKQEVPVRHREAMVRCKTLEELKNYALANGLGWFDEAEIKKLRAEAVLIQKKHNEEQN